jgi:hypothetical protein
MSPERCARTPQTITAFCGHVVAATKSFALRLAISVALGAPRDVSAQGGRRGIVYANGKQGQREQRPVHRSFTAMWKHASVKRT